MARASSASQESGAVMIGRSTWMQMSASFTLLFAGMGLAWKVGTEVQKLTSTVESLQRAVQRMDESQRQRFDYWIRALREANAGVINVPEIPK
jgi:hypothetical protein